MGICAIAVGEAVQQSVACSVGTKFEDRPRIAGPAASQALEQLYEIARNNQTVTLVYAAKDEAHNNAVVLRDLLQGMRKPPSSSGPGRVAAARARARMPRG